MRKSALTLLLSASASAASAAAQAPSQPAAPSPCCAHLAALTQDPAVAEAHWGISVVTLDGAPLCQINAGQLFRPASTAKLFTIATALAVLGPDHTTETRVLGDFAPKTGTVKGDLTLLGGGDANLDSDDLPYVPPAERLKPTPAAAASAAAASGAASAPNPLHDLNDLAAQLVARGVKRVTGDVVGDDTMFAYQPYPDSWNADDLVWGYGAPVSALTIADNQMRLVVTPGKPGGCCYPGAQVVLQQNGASFYAVEKQVSTNPKEPSGVGVERPAGRQLRVFGNLPAGAAPDPEEIAVDDPAAYAAMLFRSVLAAHGIVVQGSSRAEHKLPDSAQGFLSQLNAPLDREAKVFQPERPCAAGLTPAQIIASCSIFVDELQTILPPVLAAHQSAPLAQDVVFTAKASQNLHAELLLRLLANVAPRSRETTTIGTVRDLKLVQGARVVRAFAQHAGVDLHDFLLYDGSGLSDHDLVAPRAQTSLLVFAAKQPWFPVFKSALPVGGVDGTLAARFKAPSPLAGKDTPRLWAKTGTLGESRALAGYVIAASGQTVVFSILVDTHLPGFSADRTAMDRIVEAIAAEN